MTIGRRSFQKVIKEVVHCKRTWKTLFLSRQQLCVWIVLRAFMVWWKFGFGIKTDPAVVYCHSVTYMCGWWWVGGGVRGGEGCCNVTVLQLPACPLTPEAVVIPALCNPTLHKHNSFTLLPLTPSRTKPSHQLHLIAGPPVNRFCFRWSMCWTI